MASAWRAKWLKRKRTNVAVRQKKIMANVAVNVRKGNAAQ
jgi:hypothetical protein